LLSVICFLVALIRLTTPSTLFPLHDALPIWESLIDIVERPGHEPAEHVGGSPANVAVGLARLGRPVELTTWFGRDARGRRIREWLAADGVVVTAGSDGAQRTSTARARLDPTGAADYDFDLSYDG